MSQSIGEKLHAACRACGTPDIRAWEMLPLEDQSQFERIALHFASRLTTADEWLPIASAPYDDDPGKRILVAAADWGQATTTGAYNTAPECLENWHNPPTHWRDTPPLPGPADGVGRAPRPPQTARQAPGIAQDSTPNPNQGSEE